MLKNNNINRVIAVVVAIVLWAYVVGEVNPVADTVVHDVPISFTNQDTLENKGLAVLSSSDHSVNITVSGQRTIISKTEPSDFSVVCDVSSLEKGDNVVKLNVEGPSNLKIDNVSVEKITVVIDELITAEKPVKISITGNVEAGKEASVIDVDKNTITVEGPKTSVNKVTDMVVYIDAAEITESEKTFEVDAVPVDAGGTMIERVKSANGSKVKVSAVMYETKTVPLTVSVINQKEGKTERTYTAPDTIIIKGTKAALDKVSSVKCKTIDLGNISQTTTTIALRPILPEGVKVADGSKNLTMTVNTSSSLQKTLGATSKDITVKGAEDGKEYTIEDKQYTIEVEGNTDILSGLTIKDFVISADVSSLKDGTHEVKLTITCNKNVKSVKVSPGEATIKIS